MARGIIYLMTTTVHGLVKIGKTKIDQFETRMRFLESNGYKNVSGLKINFAIEVEDYDKKELLLFNIFSKSRVSNAELFSLNVNLIRQLLSSFDGKIIYPKENKNEVFERATIQVEKNNHSNNRTDNKKIKSEKTIFDKTFSVLPPDKYEYKVKSTIDKNFYHGFLVVTKKKLILKKGSTCAPISTLRCIAFRNSLPLKNSELQEDVECYSVSLAASVIAGHEVNGWDCWKTKNGDKIDIYRRKINVEK